MNSLDRLEKKMEKLEQKTSLSPSSSSVHQEAIDALRTNLKDELVLQLEPMNQNMATLHTGLQDAKKIFSPPTKKQRTEATNSLPSSEFFALAKAIVRETIDSLTDHFHKDTKWEQT